MPLEVRTKEEFLRYAPSASECRVVYGKETAKVKLRTPKRLVVLKVNPIEVKEITKEVKAEVIEIGTKPEKE
jgi:hypothetical protein